MSHPLLYFGLSAHLALVPRQRCWNLLLPPHARGVQLAVQWTAGILFAVQLQRVHPRTHWVSNWHRQTVLSLPDAVVPAGWLCEQLVLARPSGRQLPVLLELDPLAWAAWQISAGQNVLSQGWWGAELLLVHVSALQLHWPAQWPQLLPLDQQTLWTCPQEPGILAWTQGCLLML
mmetsp:Transcript_22839/g.64722  ORF Transcript_22839/g.64722 Transcript_22839/m.64722 type:complete len:175 (-) Transcript_22839:578-1102(-)